MRRLTVFAHYDAERQVKPYVLFHLRALRDVSERLVFVSTAELDDSALEEARAICDEALLVPNEGYDFGMWQRVLLRDDLAAWDEVVLTNSSVYGPLWPLDPLFRRMAERAPDLWGMTDNHELEWHLQSYFLVFPSHVVRSPAFTAFWRSVIPYRNKSQVIRSYELGLTYCMCDAGFTPRALAPASSAAERRRQNTTLYHPLALLDAGMPYVKVHLLRDNPARVPLAPVLRRMQSAGYDMSLIAFDRAPGADGLGSDGQPVAAWRRALARMRRR